MTGVQRTLTVTSTETGAPIRSSRPRAGVSLIFFTNGVLAAALLPRLPEIKRQFDLGDAQFGLTVAALPLGSLSAVSVAAPLIRRFGALRVAAAGSCALATAFVSAGWSPSVWFFALSMAAAGLADAIADAAQNVHGVAVESWQGRSLINSFHAAWSLGAVSGGLIGAGAAALLVPIGWQLTVNGLLWAAVALSATRLARLPTRPALENPASRHRQPPTGVGAAVKVLLLLAVLAICGTLTEDFLTNWTVLFLNVETNASTRVAGLGVSVALFMQFVGRIAGDPLTDRWGPHLVAAVGGGLISLGLVIVVLTENYLLALFGFGMVGLGSATLVPAAIADADRLPGLAKGTGVALLGWLMRLGFLAASPSVGTVSSTAGLRTAIAIPLTAGVVAAAMALIVWRLRQTTGGHPESESHGTAS